VKDFYKILGVAETATPAEIKIAYRKLAMKFHPDRKTGDETKFKEINEANDTLGDPRKRIDYDNQRRNPMHNAGFTFRQSTMDGIDQDSLSELFRQFSEMSRQQKRKPKNKDILLRVSIQLKEMLTSITKTLTYKTAKGEKTIDVDIPTSLNTANRVIFGGKGDDTINNIPAGDLIVEFNVVIPQGFSIEIANVLCCPIKISVWDALIGKTLTFTNFDDVTYEVKIPPGTQPGARFLLKGKGIPLRGNHRGDLLLDAIIRIPPIKEPEKIEIINKLMQEKQEK